MRFKLHQQFATVALIFFLGGALLHYVLISPNLNKRLNESYSEGYTQGVNNTVKEMVNHVIDSDSTIFDRNEVSCKATYYIDSTTYIYIADR